MLFRKFFHSLILNFFFHLLLLLIRYHLSCYFNFPLIRIVFITLFHFLGLFLIYLVGAYCNSVGAYCNSVGAYCNTPVSVGADYCPDVLRGRFELAESILFLIFNSFALNAMIKRKSSIFALKSKTGSNF